MTIEEFLDVMANNADEFPEFAAMDREQQVLMVNTNIVTGPAETFRDADGRVIGVGGVRIAGVGEAWLITPRDIRCHPDYQLRKQKFQEFLAVTQKNMKRMFDENNLWRVFAEGALSTNFLEQLGFERINKTLVWSRT